MKHILLTVHKGDNRSSQLKAIHFHTRWGPTGEQLGHKQEGHPKQKQNHIKPIHGPSEHNNYSPNTKCYIVSSSKLR
eukprot:4219882-Amphidinium_carterae.1